MVAQVIINGIQRSNGCGLVQRCLLRSCLLARKALLTTNDPLVRIEVNRFPLLAPLSHMLPLYTRSLPQYNTNLGRLAAAVHKAHPDGTAIDVGANIGDSVAYIRGAASIPILCIEGSEFFYSLLLKNLRQFPDVDSVLAIVGDDACVGKIVMRSGTGHISEPMPSSPISNSPRSLVPVQGLANILKTRPRFQRPKLLKIDTDGFDTKILRGAADVLDRARPVIYFEYDPFFLGMQRESGIDIFPFLASLGYRICLVYENTGDLMISIPANDQRHWEELHEFFRGRRSQRYCDIAAFHAEDEAIAEEFRQSELTFFGRTRPDANVTEPPATDKNRSSPAQPDPN